MYTHYFRELTCTPQLADAARELIETSDVTIVGPYGEGEPIISGDEISFNGEGPDGCEPFYLGPEGSNWCKTSRRPYDQVVAALLAYAILSESPGWESISSDGQLEEIEWADAIELYETCFGRLGEEEFSLLLSRIGRPLVQDEITGKWVEWDGER